MTSDGFVFTYEYMPTGLHGTLGARGRPALGRFFSIVSQL